MSCWRRWLSESSRSRTTAPLPRLLPAGGSPIQALILGIFFYTGFEWVTTNAEEVVRPRIIPRAMLVAIAVLAVSQALFAVAMGLTVGPAGRATAYPQLLAAQHALGHAGLLVMLCVTA